ncbi:MAG TPA: TOBE domain-containing protein [bacterium]|nr:TOBE domain-containing protein [bacterium]
MKDFLTTGEAAQLLHLHPKRVQALARAGRLPVVRVGRRWLFPRERLLTVGERSPRPAAPRRAGLSARNQLTGRITALSLGDVMAEVRVDVGGAELVAVITRSSAERLGLAVGAEVLAVIKATEVMIGRP